MEPQHLIQQNIREHGRIKKARLLNGNEYAVQYSDGFIHVVSDPRVGSEGPIKSVELPEGPDQMLSTNFENLWSTAIFAGPDETSYEEATLPTGSRLEHA